MLGSSFLQFTLTLVMGKAKTASFCCCCSFAGSDLAAKVISVFGELGMNLRFRFRFRFGMGRMAVKGGGDEKRNGGCET